MHARTAALDTAIALLSHCPDKRPCTFQMNNPCVHAADTYPASTFPSTACALSRLPEVAHSLAVYTHRDVPELLKAKAIPALSLHRLAPAALRCTWR